MRLVTQAQVSPWGQIRFLETRFQDPARSEWSLSQETSFLLVRCQTLFHRQDLFSTIALLWEVSCDFLCSSNFLLKGGPCPMGSYCITMWHDNSITRHIELKSCVTNHVLAFELSRYSYRALHNMKALRFRSKITTFSLRWPLNFLAINEFFSGHKVFIYWIYERHLIVC